jgi:hypothetical protein
MKFKIVFFCVLSCFLVIGTSLSSVNALEIINLVGDKDQNPPPDPDGVGIIHELDDPAGFDMRQAWGTTVSWMHDVSSELQGLTITSARLDIAVVGLIDGQYGINNKLFVDGIEIPGAFDNSNDGWRLYSFVLDIQRLLDGKLNVSIQSDPIEGWGGPDYSELHVVAETTTSVPEPTTMLFLWSGLFGLVGLRRKFKKSTLINHQ